MRLAKAFLPTLKEDPTEAEIISHKLMLRSGMLRKVAAGIYAFLPFGFKVLQNVTQIVRQEMDAIGAQEILMSIMQPAELWQQTGRWYAYGDEMMRLKDRHQRDFCLGPTHEELVTSLVKEVKSYRNLPLTVYQIAVKFRDEIRPRFGVMRSREFIMKDAYSFHATEESLDETYALMHQAYGRVVQRCGLEYRAVKAASGLIGGAQSEEFMVLAATGEDVIIYCPNCSYAANLETATSKWHQMDGVTEPIKPIEKVSTPGKTAVAEVASFLNVKPEKLVKTVLFNVDGEPVAALVPGHKEVNPAKLAMALQATVVTPFTEADFKSKPQFIKGYVGPVGLSIKTVADHSLKAMKNFVTGANEKDAHLINVNVDQDFAVDIWADLTFAQEGERCPECERGLLKQVRGIEVGHIFKLGTKYSEKMQAFFLDEKGQSRPFIMGCYGIGVSRLVAAAIEQKNDKNGPIWPKQLAPYQTIILPLLKEDKIVQASDSLYQELQRQGYTVIYDDRDVSPGVKFSTADLLGIPWQIIVGKKFLTEEVFELKVRETDERFKFKQAELFSFLKTNA